MAFFDDYFNWYDILVNELAGGQTIFIMLILLAVSIILVKARAQGMVVIMTLLTVFGMLSIYFENLRWFVVIMLVGFGMYLITKEVAR